MTTLAGLSLLIWLYLLLAHGRFWQSGPELAPARPAGAPPVTVVVPARDEAPLIGADAALAAGAGLCGAAAHRPGG